MTTMIKPNPYYSNLISLLLATANFVAIGFILIMSHNLLLGA